MTEVKSRGEVIKREDLLTQMPQYQTNQNHPKASLSNKHICRDHSAREFSDVKMQKILNSMRIKNMMFTVDIAGISLFKEHR